MTFIFGIADILEVLSGLIVVLFSVAMLVLAWIRVEEAFDSELERANKDAWKIKKEDYSRFLIKTNDADKYAEIAYKVRANRASK